MEDIIRTYLVETDKGSYAPVIARLLLFQRDNKDKQYGITTTCIDSTDEYVTYAASLVSAHNGLTLFSIEHTQKVNGDYVAARNKAQLRAIGKLLALVGYGTEYALELKTDVLERTSKGSKSKMSSSSNLRFLIENLKVAVQTLNDIYPDKHYTLEEICNEVIGKSSPQNEEEAHRVKKYLETLYED